MRPSWAVLAAAFLAAPAAALRNNIKPCPAACSNSNAPFDWTDYHSPDRLTRCKEPMLLDFSLFSPLNATDLAWTILACTPDSDQEGSTGEKKRRSDSNIDYEETELSLQLASWGASTGSSKDTDSVARLLKSMQTWLSESSESEQYHIFGQFGKATAGLYIGPRFDRSGAAESIVQKLLEQLEGNANAPLTALQHCASEGEDTIGVAVSTNGDLNSIQRFIRQWRAGECPSDYDHATDDASDISVSAAPETVAISSLHRRSPFLWEREAASCRKILAQNGDSCATLASRCGISGADFLTYNPGENLCSTLVPGQPVCCTSGGLREISPGLSPSLVGRQEATCKVIRVEPGEICETLATRCGISGDDFMKYNPQSGLCGNLRAGQPVCCTQGDLPDFSPDPYQNGTCYTHRVNTGEDCSLLAATYTLKLEDIETFNEKTWGWLGCGNLQASLNICLSKGIPPFPAPFTEAACGPQKPGTKPPTDDSTPAEWALLNQCPLNACCNRWGWCGINPEFCERKESETGNPGTGLCISNCGMSVVNDDIPPEQYARVGYFLASNVNRECLTMNAYSIRTKDYTHIQFAFGNIGDDYSIGLMEGDEEQFNYFKRMTAVKRVISFGGWDFSTFPATYHIFRNGVKQENREKFAKNVVDFVTKHDLDGVDFDWEYPGAPDIPDIPAADEEDGERYLEFLKLVRAQLPQGKSLSIAAPASFWYLQAFPIDKIADLVDYIVYMTYDLRGQWDHESNDPPLGCPGGNCLRSHINSTETQYSLAMITKAQVQTKKLMVGVSSYGRSFEMSQAGCSGPTCTFTGNGAAKGRCTKTSGYLANAEISEILEANANAVHSYDSNSDSDIIVYNENQWAAYMTDETRKRRIDKYSGMNMGGSVEWSIDLQSFTLGTTPPGGIFVPIPEDMDIDEFCSEPDWDKVTEADASAQRNVSAYFDYFFDKVRGGSTSNWAQELFGDTQTVTCDVYPDGQCDFPTPKDCKEMESPSLYWARFAVANFFQHIVQYGSMFEASTINSTLNIGKLVSDFPIKTPDTTSRETIFGIFAGALGMASAGASVAKPGSPGGAGASAAMAGFGGMWSIVAAAVKDAEPPDDNDLERALNAQLGIIWDAGYTAAGKMLVAVFGDGDISDFPKDLKGGNWDYEISNFFDGRWLAKLKGKEINTIQTLLGENMMRSLAASTLAGANYYIMKGGFDKDDCSDQNGGKVIDGTCYTLEYPGDGKSSAQPKRGDFSKVVEEDTLKKITDTYKIDLEELYKSSIACQSKTKDYGGHVDSGTFGLFTEDDKPDCFYGVPVMVANEEDMGRESWRTPCWAKVQNMTSTSDDKPIVGETYLPPNLAKIFRSEFCVPCTVTTPGCNNG